MKRKSRLLFPLAVLALAIGFGARQLWAAVLQDGIRSSVVAGGGGLSTSANIKLHGTVGQPASGPSLTGGTRELHGGFWGDPTRVVVGVEDDAPHLKTELFAPTPNPFNPRTTLRLRIERDAEVRMEIHDSRGRLVRVLVDEPLGAGSHEFEWDGRSDAGVGVASGVYYAHLVSGGQLHIQKMTLIK